MDDHYTLFLLSEQSTLPYQFRLPDNGFENEQTELRFQARHCQASMEILEAREGRPAVGF
jgi:hypothetical protein